MKILNETQIRRKIKRLSIEILENNYNEQEIILAGINNKGMQFARLLMQELQRISNVNFILTQIKLNPASPLSADVEIGLPVQSLWDKVIIIVDDVANTGRTIFYASKPLMSVIPKKLEAAVLVNRTHKAFPVKVDYVGLSLATTLKENIEVELQDSKEMAVFLD
jgi:pyrimidine operon attenuation protein/uracil phosphoribosyltransferase